MKKREDYVSPAARNAAERHEERTGHPTFELYDDDGNMNGMCCANQACDWMRYNVQPRRPRPSELQARYNTAKREELRLMNELDKVRDRLRAASSLVNHCVSKAKDIGATLEL